MVMKRFFVLLLALIFVFSFSSLVFADESAESGEVSVAEGGNTSDYVWAYYVIFALSFIAVVLIAVFVTKKIKASD